MVEAVSADKENRGIAANVATTKAQMDGTLAVKKEEKDPIFDGSSSEEEEDKNSDDESSEAEEEEGIDIEFPRESAEELSTFLHREFTNISNMEDNQKRKFALLKLYQVFVLANKKAPARVYQEILPNIQKALFKRFTDPVEKNRELACLIVKEFFTQVDDLTLSIPYLIPILVARLNADDLEGYDYLPQEMKPKAE